jgi:WD40 repeat protein
MTFMFRARRRNRILGVGVTAIVGLTQTSATAAAQEAIRVSVDSSGAQSNSDSGEYDVIAISADGTVIAFRSEASNLVAGDTNATTDVFVHDTTTGTTERVSVDSSGKQGNDYSIAPSISDDGRFVAFVSAASNLVSGDKNGQVDVFVRDRVNGTTERVSVDSSGAESNDSSGVATLTADGNLVTFASRATNLVANDTNGSLDVFVRDRTAGTTERVSVDSSGVEGDADSGSPGSLGISADGLFVVFTALADNLVPFDGNGVDDIFVHDRSTGATERVSLSTQGVEGNNYSQYPSISSDGRVVVFQSTASNLVANDTNGYIDVFVHDRSAGTTDRISVSSSGAQADNNVFLASVRSDGLFAVFVSAATNLVPGDTNRLYDVFLRDLTAGSTERVSVDSSGGQGNNSSENAAIAGSGNAVAFASSATNLVANDTNHAWDVFVRDVCLTDAEWSNYGAGFPGTNGIPAFTARQNPAFGKMVTLDLANSYANPTTGAIFVGGQRASFPSNRGGDLLVAPFLVVPITFSYGGDTFTGTIPDDQGLCAVLLDLQAIESDPGAAFGVSFTAGLELVIGR